jgi:hypothetical protein
MPNSALSPVSAGIYAKLNVASLKSAVPTGAGCLGGVRDYIPQPMTFPFMFYELAERDISGLGQGPSVKQIDLRLHVFSQYAGAIEAQRIMTEAIRLLQFSEPTATGWQVPVVGRPDDVVFIEFSELNGVVVRELVAIWSDFFAVENSA